MAETTVLVSGASSQLGVFLLPRLAAAGYRVLALSRRAPAVAVAVAPRVNWRQSPVAAGRDASPVRALVSCGPLSVALDILQSAPGLQQAIVFSTSSVWSKSDSKQQSERGQMADIAALEADLRAHCGERGVALLLLRPTLIWGCGRDRNISLLAHFGRRFGFIPLAGAAPGLRQPVHADDLAALAVRALDQGCSDVLESPACGGSTLSYREMAARIATACERPVRLLTLPPPVLAGLVRGAALLPRYRGLNPEMVRRQSTDLVFDDSPLRETLRYNPRPFRPGPRDFTVPDYALPYQLFAEAT